MSSKTWAIFLTAGIVVLGLIGGSLYIPSKLIVGLPLLLWFWIIGIIIFGKLLLWGVKCYDE